MNGNTLEEFDPLIPAWLKLFVVERLIKKEEIRDCGAEIWGEDCGLTSRAVSYRCPVTEEAAVRTGRLQPLTIQALNPPFKLFVFGFILIFSIIFLG